MSRGVPYSSPIVPTIGQIKNVSLDLNTLADGDVIKYDSATNVWINGLNGGGGVGISINGINDDVVFKNLTNGDTFTGGISRNKAIAGKAMNLDTTNFRVGIGGASNALNPVNTCEIYGDARIKEKAPGTNEIVISGDNIGNLLGGSTLRLYSNNSIVPEDIVEVDGFNRTCSVGGTMRTLVPTAFDFPNSTIVDGLYKMKLDNGVNLFSGAFFDPQNPFNAASVGFPAGATLEYQNQQLINGSIVVCRNAIASPFAP